jgi:hypothetical protein
MRGRMVRMSCRRCAIMMPREAAAEEMLWQVVPKLKAMVELVLKPSLQAATFLVRAPVAHP